ncbi:PLC-like phosphodiesterase [Mollisia scopiformis]|uniref:PLC-like phosphodiesterase n=1 Tax=Mollisia scopiformis TaxID=149040 RepID=A0A194X3K8_MOLSC|nr:PLC-like phosphodiesterase [Mollisia scopiformis]KUJ14780.1 PLC-like phosphodiesterase [Mollisia scopiformis]
MTETTSGNWETSDLQLRSYFPVQYVVSGDLRFKFWTNFINGVDWMQQTLHIIGDKTLSQISIPGSHDSGMSVNSGGTFAATDGVVQTQSLNIMRQLVEGIRYFDIRPVLGNGKWYCGHYGDTGNSTLGWQGRKDRLWIALWSRSTSSFPNIMNSLLSICHMGTTQTMATLLSQRSIGMTSSTSL